MIRNDRRIFRKEAVRRYAQARGQSVLPRLAAPRIIAALWLVLGLLLAATLGLWLIFVQ